MSGGPRGDVARTTFSASISSSSRVNVSAICIGWISPSWTASILSSPSASSVVADVGDVLDVEDVEVEGAKVSQDDVSGRSSSRGPRGSGRRRSVPDVHSDVSRDGVNASFFLVRCYKSSAASDRSVGHFINRPAGRLDRRQADLAQDVGVVERRLRRRE